jgi:3-dehydroquinate synthase
LDQPAGRRTTPTTEYASIVLGRSDRSPVTPFPSLEQRFEVVFHYQVLFTEHVFAADNSLLADTLSSIEAGAPCRFLCVAESGLVRHWPDLAESIQAYASWYRDILRLVEPPLLVAGGEQVKNAPGLVSAVQDAINRGGICRHSFVLAVGGGALLDMVGYAAATAHRGVRLIRVPTTVLAQADSGVGVKNSVNAFGKKNFVGTFAPPAAVINDAQFLTTLPDREWRSGIAEAIKVALLKDAATFEEIEELAPALASRDMAAMRRVIYRCAQLHLEHIATSGDPFEFGSSRPLDMGHWAAHKLESLSNYRLLHGEAVAIGLALDATYAREIGLLAPEVHTRLLKLLERVGLPRFAPELAEHVNDPEHPRCILRGLNEFREHLGGRLSIVLPRRIGHGVEFHNMDLDTIRACVELLRVHGAS